MCLEVVVPWRPDPVLAAQVPHGETGVLVLRGLHDEAYCGNGGHSITQLQFVQDGGLSHSI